MKVTDDPVIVEQTFHSPIGTVWKAISDPELMRQWFFENIPSFKADVGFETQFNIQNEGRDFLHLWRVTEAIPPKRLVYDWSYDGYSGDAYVVWELFPDGETTRLRLTLHVREDFPDDIPEFKRESCVAGWEYFIQERLKDFLTAQ